MPKIVYDHSIFSLQQFGGISRYFCEVAARVSRHPGWCSTVVAPLHYNDHLADSPVRRFGLHVRMRAAAIGRVARAANLLLAPPMLAACGGDLLHRTYYTSTPRPARGRLVVTVFDMIHELFPQHFPPGDPVRELKRRCVHAADHVICISHCTARDLIRLLDVPPHKVSVTHLGFSDSFADARPGAGPAPAAGERPYLLYVGHRGGYKNFARVLEAYAASPRLQQDFDLVAFGGSAFDDAERSRIDALRLRPSSVRRIAGSDADLARAYAGAHVFVYPSEYEGFGIPPLESMSCGCAVACSNTSSIPEVVGEAGDYFDPTRVDSIRCSLERIAYDDARRQSLIAAGHAQRRRFSWDRCAEQTLDVYRATLAGAPVAGG